MTNYRQATPIALCVCGLLLAAAALSGCRVRSHAVSHPDAFESRIAIRDTAARRVISLDTLVARMAAAEVTFLGETHLDEVTHEVERMLLAGLLERTRGRVVLALEMFTRAAQPSIDEYLAGDLSEAEFLEKSNPWGNYVYDYRPLVELAREWQAPVVGSNAPRDLAVRVQMGGAETFAALSGDDREHVATEMLPGTHAYWQRFARAMRGHAGDPGSMHPEAMRFTVQNVWDNTMAQSCVEALDENPEHRVLHVNGGFHSAYRLGTVHQLRERRPGVRVVTVQIVSVPGLDAVPPDGEPAPPTPGLDEPYADYVVYATRRGGGAGDGTHAVSMPADLHFRWQLPDVPPGTDPGPLLVWLGDSEVSARSMLSYWKRALGGEVALAVVEPPYPLPGATGDTAGQWLRRHRRFGDLGALSLGLERLRDYFVRQHGVQRERVVFAGEGSGGGVLAALALRRSDTLLDGALVMAPRRHRFQREIPFPDPREPAPDPTLRVWVHQGERDWWDQEARDQAGVGRSVQVTTLAEADGYGRLDLAEAVIRQELQLGPASDATADPSQIQRRLILVRTCESPVARFWAQRVARELRQPGLVVETVSLNRLPYRLAEGDAGVATSLEVLGFRHETSAADSTGADAGHTWSVESVARGAAIPLLPGTFVGPTVLVVPASVPESERAAWRALETDRVVGKRNRFARLRVAFEDGGPSAGEVLEDEIARGTDEVLVVPARFGATGGTMQRLRGELSGYEDQLHVTWVSGLGGELWRAAGELRPEPSPKQQ